MSALRLLCLTALACVLASCSGIPSGTPGIERLAPNAPERSLPPAAAAITPAELVRLSKDGMKDDAIIRRIKETGSRYTLTASQAIELHEQGVSSAVLDYLFSAREQDLLDRSSEAINLCERRSAEALGAERERARNTPYCDPYWQPYPGYGWMGGGIYRRW